MTMTNGTGSIAWDGPVDPAIEQHAARVVRDAHEERVGTEAVAHALLRLVAERPGQMGRMRAARIVGGYSVPCRDEEERLALEPYAVCTDRRMKELVQLVDALIDGGLLAQTAGPRPVVVLTRAGHHALDALEGLG